MWLCGVKDIDASIDWYTTHTPIKLLEKREDADGYGAWLGHDDSPDKPFILVLAQFFPESDPFKDAPIATLAPFAHLGVEVTSREEIDAAAERARAEGCLAMPPREMPPPNWLHLHDQRSRRQHDRAQLRPGRVRPRPKGDALSASADDSSTTGDPRAVAASYLASFASGDPEAVAAHVSDGFSNVHTSALGLPSEGKAEYRARLADFLATFAGLTYEAEEIIVEGDRVAAAYVMRARADGKPFEIRGVMRLTVREGLIERRVDYFDSLTFLRQTGQA